MSEQVKSREAYKKLKYQENKETQAEVRPSKQQVRVRLIPIWLRLILLVVFIFISLAAGAMVGYGVLGNGKTMDVFKESTWTHIRDLIDKK
jgi:DNA-directed RNA polymerase subunit beta